MRKTVLPRAFVGLVAVLFLFLRPAKAAGQQDSASREGSVGAAVLAGLSLQKSQDLVLGEFRPGDVPGTVELNVLDSGRAASRESSGGVALAGSAFSVAEFSVSAHAGAPVHFTVELPPAITIQRIGGGESMRVDGFRSQVRQECRSGDCPGVPYTLQVGATLHVDPRQRAGNYVGTFTVTVNQS